MNPFLKTFFQLSYIFQQTPEGRIDCPPSRPPVKRYFGWCGACPKKKEEEEEIVKEEEEDDSDYVDDEEVQEEEEEEEDLDTEEREEERERRACRPEEDRWLHFPPEKRSKETLAYFVVCGEAQTM